MTDVGIVLVQYEGLFKEFPRTLDVSASFFKDCPCLFQMDAVGTGLRTPCKRFSCLATINLFIISICCRVGINSCDELAARSGDV